jgi:arylsulfatase A-like enzyme
MLLPALVLLAACGDGAPPPEITIEHVVSAIAPPLAPGAVVAEPSPGAVRRDVLQPGDRAGNGGPRDAVVAPPPAQLRFRLDVPPDAVLHFSAGVEGERRRDTSRGGVEFRVVVDGKEAFADTLNPAYTRHDRRWVDAAVDLQPWGGRTVDVTLETRAEDPGRPLAGTAGWSHVRMLRKERVVRQRANDGPNVLLVLVDTLRADRLGIYGAGSGTSAALDRFAARGLVFDVAVAQSSWTMPSVASIFTGLHPRSHGAVGPDVQDATGDAGGTLLADDVVTLAELAQEAGVSTVGVSSNMLVSRGTNLAQGFETFVELPYDPKQKDHAPASAVNRAFLDWLRRARDVRFLAYLHYMDVHGPYWPPANRPAPPAGMRSDLAVGFIQDFARKMNAGELPPPPPAHVEYLRALYDEDIRGWDKEFGLLIRDLAAQGVLDHTVVVVVADHGEEFLEHGNLTHGGHLYEESVHVPLVIVGPGVAPGRRSDIAQGIDLLPTISGLLGLSVPRGLSGRDVLTTHTADGVVSEIVSGFGGDGAGSGTVALRTARWKLIRPPGPALELYDLATDPGEHTNVAANAPESATLAASLDRWAGIAPPPPRMAGSDPSLRRKLRQLGYIE